MKLVDEFRRIPLTIRVPAMVAALMIVVSAIISERVLSRLYETQQQHMAAVVGTYLDGLSNALIPPVLRGDIWETYDILDRTPSTYGVLVPLETIVTGRDGRVLASSHPKSVAPLAELPAEYADRPPPTGGMQIDWEKRTGFGRRDLLHQGRPVGAIHASFDISHLIAERREVLNTLLATNAALAIAFATVGYLLARRMVRPVKTLADHMRSGASATPRPIALEEFPRREGEFAELFHGFNALVEAERERSALTLKLAEEEKLASLGRLASSMAHEINNPLGGLFNCIDTLQRHGADESVRETSLSLLERGLTGIRDVVRAALATYRADRSGRPLTVQDLDDVRLLIGPEIARRQQTLNWERCPDTPSLAALSGVAVRQALLNLVLNASTAAGDGGKISVQARFDAEACTLVLAVGDSGPGLSSDALEVLVAPDPAPASRRANGLGLWMVRKMVDETGGRIRVGESDSAGALVELHLPLRDPLEVNHAA
ncbi:histidine kinase (plasmid) [Sinorhizobium americanum CCGM7]|uniref:sensor histidine kinase n=1 Tax=Sinorhizobium americanum TaxID=194963 RepID=UPI0004D872FB|nr:HAMP domain-containing sensor histidine kinase [Sinorhizobium americanum]APG87496.1 histidine kinase [Sinorhizobium americanum CCGM7]